MTRILFFLKAVLIITGIIFFNTCLFSQNEKSESDNSGSGFYIRSAGISLGWYNPSLDYWKDESEFSGSDFNGAIYVNALMELHIAGNFSGRVGLGYWQEKVEDDLQGFGNTKLLFTSVPINLDVFYKPVSLKFSVFSPYIGLGGEFLFLQNKLKFEEYEGDDDLPDPENGSTFLGYGLIGIEAELSENFAIDMEFQYKYGKYKQDFKIEKPDETIQTVTEDILLSGPKIGITLKYLF